MLVPIYLTTTQCHNPEECNVNFSNLFVVFKVFPCQLLSVFFNEPQISFQYFSYKDYCFTAIHYVTLTEGTSKIISREFHLSFIFHTFFIIRKMDSMR
jgi:hypothetical protein